MSRNMSETDRKKNQFDKEERVHLLAIMKRYAPLLDKSTSTLARKRIWTSIEEEFKKEGFTRKTSAQLKKYWQNYKYHCKKAKALGKESKKSTNSDDNESLEWNRYQVFVDNRTPIKFSDASESLRSMPDRSQRSPLESRHQSADMYQNGTHQHENSPGKSNSSDVCIDLSRVKEERDEEVTTHNDRDTEGTNTSKDLRIDEDSLDEKKEIFTNEDQLVSSSTNATKYKTRNRIVVSNAKISNNSVTVSVIYPEDNNGQVSKNALDGTLDECSSPPTRKPANVSWNEHEENSIQSSNAAHSTPLFDYPNLFEHHSNRGKLDETKENANNEKLDSSGCNGVEGLIRARQSDQDFGGMERREKYFESQNDPFRSRSCVFLTDYRNRLRHRLLLQQLETEEKRLKVKIAEMTYQEVQLRIKALYEDMRRTEELHRLRLLQAATSAAVAAGNGKLSND